jgi:predicted Zn finger-like uncharacterized protein
MRVQCPQCQTVLQLAEPPLPGVKVQCGTCGALFGVRTAVKPVVIPTSAPAVVPVAVTEVPGSVAESEAPVATVKKKKKKKFKKKSGGFLKSTAGTFILSAVILGVVVTGGVILAVQTGLFSGRSLVQFNDELVGIVNRLEKSGDQLLQQGGGRSNPAQALQQIDVVRTSVANALSDAKKISPPREGEAFHGAVVQFLERLERFFGTDIKQAISLASNGQQKQAMQMLVNAMTDLEQLQTSYINAQQQFARKHGLRLLEKPKTAPGFGRQRDAGPGWGAFGIE